MATSLGSGDVLNRSEFRFLNQRQKPLRIPVKAFHPVARLVEEDEKYGVEHRHLDIEFDQGGHTVDGFSKIDQFGVDMNFFYFGFGSHLGCGLQKNRKQSVRVKAGALNVGFMDCLRVMRCLQHLFSDCSILL